MTGQNDSWNTSRSVCRRKLRSGKLFRSSSFLFFSALILSLKINFHPSRGSMCIFEIVFRVVVHSEASFTQKHFSNNFNEMNGFDLN